MQFKLSKFSRVIFAWLGVGVPVMQSQRLRKLSTLRQAFQSIAVFNRLRPTGRIQNQLAGLTQLAGPNCNQRKHVASCSPWKATLAVECTLCQSGSIFIFGLAVEGTVDRFHD